MPTRFIHSRSLVIPSRVMLPLVQCHQVRGLAESGGFRNRWARASASLCACVGANEIRTANTAAAAGSTLPGPILIARSSRFGMQRLSVDPEGRCGSYSQPTQRRSWRNSHARIRGVQRRRRIMWFGKGAIVGVAATIPLALLCALVFRFPVPFAGYLSGPRAIVPVLI